MWLRLMSSNISRYAEALCLKPFVVCEICLNAEAREHFLRIEVYFAVQLHNRSARIFDGFLACPFHDGDKVEIRTGSGT